MRGTGQVSDPETWTLLESNRTEGDEGLVAVWLPETGGFRTTPDKLLAYARGRRRAPDQINKADLIAVLCGHPRLKIGL
jgi:hypothetical protein